MILRSPLLLVLTAAIAFTPCSKASDLMTINPHRRLAYESLGGFEPLTLITNFAAVDLDILAMEDQLENHQFEGFKSIYEHGGYSNSVARITLADSPTPPVREFLPDTLVVGWSHEGEVVRGRLLEGVMWNSWDTNATLLIEYEASPDQKNYLKCQVGGLVAINEEKKDGCKPIHFLTGENGQHSWESLSHFCLLLLLVTSCNAFSFM
jgi:hypothetical protein